VRGECTGGLCWSQTSFLRPILVPSTLRYFSRTYTYFNHLSFPLRRTTVGLHYTLPPQYTPYQQLHTLRITEILRRGDFTSESLRALQHCGGVGKTGFKTGEHHLEVLGFVLMDSIEESVCTMATQSNGRLEKWKPALAKLHLMSRERVEREEVTHDGA
jgi:hypothetical protein